MIAIEPKTLARLLALAGVEPEELFDDETLTVLQPEYDAARLAGLMPWTALVRAVLQDEKVAWEEDEAESAKDDHNHESSPYEPNLEETAMYVSEDCRDAVCDVYKAALRDLGWLEAYEDAQKRAQAEELRDVCPGEPRWS